MFRKDRANLQRDFSVDLEPRLREDQFWTFPACDDRGHRGADTKLTRLVACRRDDAAFAGASDHDGLSAQLRIVTLFDGRKEGVHVDVDDLTRALRARFGIAVRKSGLALAVVMIPVRFEHE